jgi:haloacetate dehalogenase
MQLNFRNQIVKNGDVNVSVNVTGSGAPLLLIHGYPETHLSWHKIVPELAKRYTVICPDLRGNGASDKPVGAPDHSNYSKRAMASDMIAIMDELGFDRFKVVAHDRGARVTHRLCLDYPDRVSKAVLLDIIPTSTLYETVNKDVATAYYHWFFLIQNAPLPENMIAGNPLSYLHWALGARIGGIDAVDPEVLAALEKNFQNPDVIHATCEDYRAGASIDLEHDKADSDSKIQCPILVSWGTLGPMGKMYDILSVWQDKAVNVQGLGLECGHYLSQEKPEELLAALNDFL